MVYGNHYEGFEKEEKFLETYCKVKEIAPSLYLMRDFKKVVQLINPELLEGLYDVRPCKRMLRYIGHNNWPEVQKAEMNAKDSSLFNGEIYYSIDFTGATYSFEGYVNAEGNPKRIGCVYFEWLK